MSAVIGIRREDKNEWERRAPLTPAHVGKLAREHGIRFVVQPGRIRVFPDEAYALAGATVQEDLSGCDIVLAIKEIPVALLEPRKTYVFFAHVIKGQHHNMPMLRRLLEQGCNLIDYERIVDERNRRLVFFGRYAGLAGMLDTLWALGQRLEWEGTPTPLSRIRMAHGYASLDEALEAVADAGRTIARDGLPPALAPMVFGFAGYGHVSMGAQEVFDRLPHEVVAPADLAAAATGSERRKLLKVVFKEEHMVEPAASGAPFDLQDYYANPAKYRGIFAAHVPHLSVLVNGIYWDPRYPRLVTKEQLRALWSASAPPKLKVIGDISCDEEGSIECTVKATSPGNPVYVYDPARGEAADGVAGRGPVVMAVDNLPCELPAESSKGFSDILLPFIPAMAKADYAGPFAACALPEPIRTAVIAYQGRLTPPYEYIAKHL